MPKADHGAVLTPGANASVDQAHAALQVERGFTAEEMIFVRKGFVSNAVLRVDVPSPLELFHQIDNILSALGPFTVFFMRSHAAVDHQADRLKPLDA